MAAATAELRLADGSTVHVRPLRPDDEELLHDAFARMSERSVYFRFFSPLKRLPPALAHHLAHVDDRDRFALAATTHRLDESRREAILGVARYDRVAGTNVAEVAVAVVDTHQRLGIGRGLLKLLARAARERGVRTFALVVLPENRSMLALLRRLGWVHRSRFAGGMIEITFDLPGEPEAPA
jgi:RimJ/RimL family protein N-acetyltransferase